MPQCIIAGCANEAPYFLGVRLRRPKRFSKNGKYGSAIWAPNLQAYVCEQHAVSGLDISIQLTPNNSGTIKTDTSGGSGGISRTSPITNPADNS